MNPPAFPDVGKTAPSAFYGALSGSVCFPMPLMYNPMNSYPFMSTPFLPVHHPMLSQHGLQDSNHIINADLVGNNADVGTKCEDIGSRALAFLQNKYQGIGKCYLSPSSNRRNSVQKYCVNSDIIDAPKSIASSVFYPDEKTSTVSLSYEQEPERSGSIGMTAVSEKGSYLPSPATEVEEPDSSGKCTADVEEQKAVARRTCDPNQPPSCPICGRTIDLSELSEHYRTELERLNDLVRKKEWLNLAQDDAQSDQTTRIDPMHMHPYHNVEKRCPEFRKETYLRVRSNRMNRLGVCNARLKKQNCDDPDRSWKIHRARQLCSPKREIPAEDVATQGCENSAQQSVSEQQSVLLMELSGVPKSGDCAPLVDSSSSNFSSPNFSAFQSSKCGNELIRRCDGISENEHCTTTDVKCFICSEQYRKPVVSVCCWHVHCETCWLKALGSKRICPQCETITSPSDLRRIHL